MIGLSDLTPTSKHNFSQNLINSNIPQKMMEISLKSMEKMDGYFHPDEWVFNKTSTSGCNGVLSFPPRKDLISLHSIPLKPNTKKTTVAGIDVSSIKIGETQIGFIYATRGVIVWKGGGQYRYLRFGPFLFHITEENKREIYNLLKRHDFTVEIEANVPNLINMQTSISNLLERWIQMNACCSLKRSIILLDGSLTAGTVDISARVMSQLLEIARERLNTVLAFSKMTRLRLFGHILSDLTCECQPPYLLEIRGFPIASYRTLCFLGKLYIAKLTEGNCSFRLDIDRELPHERRLEAVQKLLGNELLFQGYPETLRLAHIFSTFTANEVLGIQHFIAQKCGLKLITRPNIRRILFGPFGFEA